MVSSTFGLLLLLSKAEVTRGPWIDFKKEPLKELMVIDIKKAGKKKRMELSALFDKKIANSTVCNSTFKAIPNEFANPVLRRIIDEELCRVLDIPLKLTSLYKLLSREPMLTG
jgi:hypothetical protein